MARLNSGCDTKSFATISGYSARAHTPRETRFTNIKVNSTINLDSDKKYPTDSTEVYATKKIK